MAQSITSVPIPPPPPHPGIGQVFVILFRKELKMPYGGAGRSRGRLKNRVQMPHPRDNTKISFSSKAANTKFMGNL